MVDKGDRDVIDYDLEFEFHLYTEEEFNHAIEHEENIATDPSEVARDIISTIEYCRERNFLVEGGY